MHQSPHHVVTTDQTLRVAEHTPTPLIFLMLCSRCCPSLLGRSVVLLAGDESAVLAQAHVDAFQFLSRTDAARIRSCESHMPHDPVVSSMARRVDTRALTRVYSYKDLTSWCIRVICELQHLVQITASIRLESIRGDCPPRGGRCPFCTSDRCASWPPSLLQGLCFCTPSPQH